MWLYTDSPIIFKDTDTASKYTNVKVWNRCKVWKYSYYFVLNGGDYVIDWAEILSTWLWWDTRWIKKREDVDWQTIDFLNFWWSWVEVAWAGSDEVNWMYFQDWMEQWKPKYVKSDNQDMWISWEDHYWQRFIWDSNTRTQYYSDQYGNKDYPRECERTEYSWNSPVPTVSEKNMVELKIWIPWITSFVWANSVTKSINTPVLASSPDSELVTRWYLDNSYYSKTHSFSAWAVTIQHNLWYLWLDLLVFDIHFNRVDIWVYTILDKNTVWFTIPTDWIYRIQIKWMAIDMPESIFGVSYFSSNKQLSRKVLNLKNWKLDDWWVFNPSVWNTDIRHAFTKDEFIYINVDNWSKNQIFQINQITMAQENTKIWSKRYTTFAYLNWEYFTAWGNNGVAIYDLATLTEHLYEYADWPNVWYMFAWYMSADTDQVWYFGRETVSKFIAWIWTSWAKSNETRLDYTSSAKLENWVKWDWNDYYWLFNDWTVQKFNLWIWNNNIVSEELNAVSFWDNNVATMNASYKDWKLYIATHNDELYIIDTATMTIDKTISLAWTEWSCVVWDKFLYVLIAWNFVALYDYATTKIIAQISDVMNVSQWLVISSNL